MKIYVAGPMRDKPRFNFPAFHSATRRLLAQGHEVISPAELDIEEGFDPDNPGVITPERYEAWMKRDFDLIEKCDAIYLLDGFGDSMGAMREREHAKKHGLTLLYETEAESRATWDGWLRFETGSTGFEGMPAGCNEEVRVTNEKTGGQKGSKPERFDLIPALALSKVARLYGAGAQKYRAWNWRKGYEWSLSIAALERHLAAFKEGEDKDPETKCEHLASVVFHALALLTYADEHPELDDRWKGSP